MSGTVITYAIVALLVMAALYRLGCALYHIMLMAIVSTKGLLQAVSPCIAVGPVAGQVRNTAENVGERWRRATQSISLALKDYVRVPGRRTLASLRVVFGNDKRIAGMEAETV
jgi:hypothetical protein